MRHRNLKEIAAEDSIYRDEQARASYFRDFYAKIEDKYLKKNPHAKDSDFTAFYERYQGLIADRITQLDAFEGGLQPTAQTPAHLNKHRLGMTALGEHVPGFLTRK